MQHRQHEDVISPYSLLSGGVNRPAHDGELPVEGNGIGPKSLRFYSLTVVMNMRIFLDVEGWGGT